MHRSPLLVAGLLLISSGATGQTVPHNQDRPPGPALSPTEALTKFRVPTGFQVKLFAAEPDVVNPIAMTFDDRGRVWVTESFEYPRRSAGAGRDRIRILEDTDGDGKADKATVFADGLNIPSGIALGYGGAFVVNSPDLLFLQDTDGDGKADRKEVLLSGFGRDDTHELPSALTWGPDGWLYGLNGVFNYSKIVHQGKKFEFTAGLWRYHPQSKKFELFAEGTSNPWGLDYDQHGNFFVSACVIDHLWHLTETGYYNRQGGPYPPFTWKIESIVKHKHQKAAYCGLCWYDAEVYPQEYRGTLFMGNIHGNCVNNDALQRKGASYFATPRPDFLATDDVWFMPVVQKVGPDGCIWVVDWYDQYHCYQDANRDPNGIDRTKGRIYRVTYHDAPAAKPFHLGAMKDPELIGLLQHPNVFYRRQARQLLIERQLSAGPESTALAAQLEKAAEQAMSGSLGAQSFAQLESIWTLLSAGAATPAFFEKLLGHADADFRTWGLRGAAALGRADFLTTDRLQKLAVDPHPDVRLQAAVVSRSLPPGEALNVLLTVLANAHLDPSELTVRIVWRHLGPALDGRMEQFVAWLGGRNLREHPAVALLLPRILERALVLRAQHPDDMMLVVGCLLNGDDRRLAGSSLRTLLTAVETGEFTGPAIEKFQSAFGSRLSAIAAAGDRRDPRYLPALGFAVLFDSHAPRKEAFKIVGDRRIEATARMSLLRALLSADLDAALPVAAKLLTDGEKESPEFLRETLASLSRTGKPSVAAILLEAYPRLPAAVAPQALDALTSRSAWAAALVDAVAAKRIAAAAVNGNQLRKMIEAGDKSLALRINSIWGQVRTERNPERERLAANYRKMIASGSKANAANGVKVFERVCAQCHQFRGKGYNVGPSLNENGRASLDQLLSNILDPNLVIGKDYQARLVITEDGRSLTGLVAEDSPTRVVLKLAGEKMETIPRSSIEKMKVSNISLMPEGLEKQTTPQEFKDLIAYLLQK